MSNFCRLNELPVELFHFLFDYFVAHEIYFSFFNISSYIDSVINCYSNHRLHLTWIRRLQFNWLCSHIQPERVLSLVLSDGHGIAGLSRLFLSRFRLEQFTQLRSITLISLEIDSIHSILAVLHTLEHLQAFSLEENSVRYLLPSRDRTTPFYFSCSDLITLSRLNRLQLKYLFSLTHSSFPHLRHIRHLELASCLSNELNLIFKHALQLRSLTVCLNMEGHRFDRTIAQNRLTTLQIKFQNRCK